MPVRDVTPLGTRFVCFGILALGLRLPLAAQTTYTPYQFSTVAGTSALGGGSPIAFNGIAVDGSDNLYVADRDSIVMISPAGVVTSLAGTAGSPGSADGAGSAARFYGPTGIAVDGSGNIYVCDAHNYTVRKITPAGAVTTLAGSPGISGSADGTGPAAHFVIPQGIAVDANGNVYVADEGANTVRKITPAGAVTTLAGSASAAGGSADGTGSAAQFDDPFGVAVDKNGDVYVAELANSTVRKLTPGGVVTTLAGTARAIGSADGTGSAAQFYWPTGVAVDGSGNVYVADSYNFTVRRVTQAAVVTTLAGIPGYPGSSDGIGPAALFTSLESVAVDGGGNLFVGSSGTIRAGHAVAQIPATLSLGNLSQAYDGTAKNVAVTTDPAGLPTIVLYEVQPGLTVATMPSNEGGYTIFAAIVDPGYSGATQGTLTIGPGLPAHTSLVVQHTEPGGSFLWGLAVGPSGLVAVGTGGTILGSRDGSTWSPRSSGTTNWLTAVTYGDGRYIAVGDNGCILTSPDGVSWATVAQSATPARLNNILFAAGIFVAVGEGGAIIASPDGQTWTAASSGVTGWLRGLTYVNGFSYQTGVFGTTTGMVPSRFVATGQGGAVISSTNGITWGNESLSNYGGNSSPAANLESVASTPSGDLVAVGDAGASVDSYWGTVGMDNPPPYEYLQNDPIPGAAVDFRGLVPCAGSMYAMGGAGTIATAQIPSSANPDDSYPPLGPWQLLSSGVSANLVSGAAIGDSVYFVGENETILRLTAPYDSRLINLSCRAQVGTGANLLIAGFVVGGTGTPAQVPLLLRASGPALAPFQVPGILQNPELQLYATGSGAGLLATNAGWGGSSATSNEAAALGAFAWADPSSHDAALLETLPPGSYTANIVGEAGDTGVALAEVYDATPSSSFTASSPRLTNLSARAQVGTGGDLLIAGFVIGGSTPKTVLIRASGPALAQFGVPGTLTDPELVVYGSGPGSGPIATNTGWKASPDIETAAARAGAFPWGGSPTPDSALLITLPPGAYTAQVTGASGDGGVALIEVYEVR